MNHPVSPAALPVRADEWHGRVWSLAWPTILSNLTIPLVGAVDTAVVGHLGDARYIGAVALGAILFSFVQWAFSFLRMGTTGFTAQAFGANDLTQINATVVRASVLAIAFGLLIVAAKEPLAWLAFHFIEGSAEVETAAREYYDIRIWSAPAALINLTVLGVLFGLQQMRAALVTQLVLNACNIVFDIWMVVVLDMGVAGVAWSSLISEIIAAIVGIALAWRVLRRLGGRWSGLTLLDATRLRGLMVVNINIFIRTLAVQLTFFYFAAIGARQGDTVLAANAVLIHLFHFMSYGLDGFAFAIEALAGSALGARNRLALRAMVISAALWSLAAALIFAALYALAGAWFVGLITSVPEVTATASAYMPWLIVAPLISVWCYLLDGVFFGATHTREARNSIAAAGLIYLLLVQLCVPTWGNHGLWFCVMVFMAVRGILLWRWYPRIEKAAS